MATRLFGNLLTWLSDHDSDVFFVGTANDIARVPPEFVRAERFDGTFFVDLPEGKEKDKIWTMYRHLFGIPESQARPDDTDWTGAEIRFVPSFPFRSPRDLLFFCSRSCCS